MPATKKKTKAQVAAPETPQPATRENDSIVYIPLDRIALNPLNPRKVDYKNNDAFKELVASIREKGVLQPIIVRERINLSTGEPYEIVAGERRWMASIIAETGSIPAIVRDVDDREAFELMTIENLQRENLDPLEEARAFEKYSSAGGDIEDLAQKIGSDPRYIRRRVRILTLPQEVLDGWKEGKVSIGHLEQFMRLSRKEDIIKTYKDVTECWEDWSVSDLRDHIDEQSAKLAGAFFDTSTCESCTMNTSAQGGLFGTDFARENALCLNAKCFKKKQVDYLTLNWKETTLGKTYSTNGFKLSGDIDWSSFNVLSDGALEPQCLFCDKLVSIIGLDGRVHYGRACIDKQCYKETIQGKGKKTKPGSEDNGGRVRVTPLGPEFQDRFYRERIPAAVSEMPYDKDPVLRIVALALINNSERTRSMFFKEMGMDHAYAWQGHEKIWEKLEELKTDELLSWIRRVSLYLTLDDMQMGFDLKHKHLMAKHLGIDLGTWQLHEEYLKRKTIPEILALCKELKIFDDPKVKEFGAGTLKMKSDKYDGLKKKDLIRLIIESGMDLNGKVPKEILKTK